MRKVYHTEASFLFRGSSLSDPKTGEKKTGAIEQQMRQVLENVLAVVVASGGDKSHIVKTTVYVSDIELWGRVNEVYAELFGLYRPARAIVLVKELHHGFQIEIEVVAALP